jgi:hypothetical protein
MAFPLSFSESRNTACRFAVFLADAFTGRNSLSGTVNVNIAGQPAGFQKPGESTWIFFNLADGAYNIAVTSDADTPYYVPVTIPVSVPASHPLWPGFPDQGLADATLMLDDPAQPAAYRAQRALATLQPTTSYPFPSGTTLIRGRVTAGGAPLSNATVLVDGGTQLSYVTGADGQYVIFFSRPTGMTQDVNLRAQHAAKPDVVIALTVQRGRTVNLDIPMAP